MRINAIRSKAKRLRIGIVAPSCTLDPAIPAKLAALAPDQDFVFHPQCFLSEGHFAGPDQAREDALVEMANDPGIDAIWFARGGYGACRVAGGAIARMGEAAQAKRYLGYSDAGFLLAGLYARGIGEVAHGPMPSGLHREDGAAAVLRGLDWLRTGKAEGSGDTPSAALNIAPPLVGTRHKQAAFNLMVFSQLLGTPLQPDLTDHVLMLEEVSEYMYRVDRAMFHVTSNANVRQVAGIMLGRVSDVPANDPDFGQSEEEVTRYWCAKASIPYLGRADIGHDAGNRVVAFG
jgi:muramoyltetrapeptide carboxypeptidase